MKPIPVFAPALCLLLSFGGVASAQLDLPDKPAPKSQPAPAPAKPAPGVDLKSKPRGDIAPKAAGARAQSGLELPPAPKAKALPAATPEPAPVSAPQAIFETLAGLRDVDGELAMDASESLLSMGAEGLATARSGLAGDDPAILFASARALLLGGLEGDRALVLSRADRRLPTRAVRPLLALLVEQTPEAQQVELLLHFCDHRQGGMRRSAADLLEPRTVDIERLERLVSSDRSEARELGYRMLSKLDDVAVPGARDELLAGLGDSNSRAAAAASRGLSQRIAGREDALVARLMQQAQQGSMDDHAAGFALFALIEAEDRLGTSLMDFESSVGLLVHLRSGDAFVKAVSAMALAGIGFRAEQPSVWLDLEVPHALVTSVAGEVYFSEYSIVRPSALRRLEMISGQHFGDEGPLWKSWWVAQARDFHALRAVIPATLADHERIEVRWSAPLEAESFRLLGSLADPGELPFPGMTLRLPPAESQALMADLIDAQVFGPNRLPGLVGTATGTEEELDVHLGQASKSFRFGLGGQADWSEQLALELRRLRDGAEWQLFPGPEFLDAGPSAFFEAEAPWWSAHRDPLERSVRLAELVVANMKLHEPLERGPAVSLLERLPAGAIGPDLFDSLADRLAEEQFFGQRARRLMAVIMAAASDTDGQLSDDAAGRLIDILFTSGDMGHDQEMASVLMRASVGFQRTAAIDPRGPIRAVSASALASRELQPEDRVLLQALLLDRDDLVQSAAVLAVSSAGLGEFRDEVQARARIGDTAVRRAAIRGVGMLGGLNALDVLRLAVLDKDISIKLAGAEAMADLADPASTTVLVQMLAGGRKGPFFDAARRGLVAIGEPAWNALLGLARNSASPAMRPAMMMLAEQEVTEVATLLMTALTEDPSDAEVALELAILTGVDFRDRPDPAAEWWSWHDAMKDMDSIAWFCVAYNKLVEQGKDLELAAGGVHLDPQKLRGAGSPEGARQLVELLRFDGPSHLVMRAVRELKHELGQDFGSLPPPGRLRGEWCDVLLTRVPASFATEEPAADAAE